MLKTIRECPNTACARPIEPIRWAILVSSLSRTYWHCLKKCRLLLTAVKTDAQPIADQSTSRILSVNCLAPEDALRHCSHLETDFQEPAQAEREKYHRIRSGLENGLSESEKGMPTSSVDKDLLLYAKKHNASLATQEQTLINRFISRQT